MQSMQDVKASFIANKSVGFFVNRVLFRKVSLNEQAYLLGRMGRSPGRSSQLEQRIAS